MIRIIHLTVNLKFMLELFDSIDHVPVFNLDVFQLLHTLLVILQFLSYTYPVKEFSVSRAQ